ncbi:MAG: hypothetical protein J4G00_02255 [Actinomycetia bacterium]|nr:hypothetical protein [Actinomycetes bacterium]
MGDLANILCCVQKEDFVLYPESGKMVYQGWERPEIVPSHRKQKLGVDLFDLAFGVVFSQGTGEKLNQREALLPIGD